jgi:HEAT repeat protein
MTAAAHDLKNPTSHHCNVGGQGTPKRGPTASVDGQGISRSRFKRSALRPICTIAMSDSVVTLAEDYAAQPGMAARAVRELRDGDDARFLEVISALRELPDSSARDMLIRLLMADDEVLMRCTHPACLPLEEAVALACRMKQLDPTIDAHLVHLVMPGSGAAMRDPWHATRVLEIVAAISDGHHIQALLPTLLRHPEPRVRSKVSLMLGRYNRNIRWLQRLLAERDPRVRANAVESMWGVASQQARELFLLASSDANQRVAANGIVGLYRAGDLESTRILRRMAFDGDPAFRASALWAMGESRDPRFLPVLCEIVGLKETGIIHRNALRSTVRIRARLAKLRGNSPLRVCAVWRRDRLEVWVRSREGEPVMNLPPTSFVVHDGSRALEVRSVRYQEEPDAPAVECYELALDEAPRANVRVGVYMDRWMGEQDAR